MKAAVLHKVHDPMTIEDFDMPKISPDEVLIKVKACGVCHTDYKVIEVLQMVRDKRVDVSGLVSKRYRFEEINDAFHDLEAGKNLMGITVWN